MGKIRTIKIIKKYAEKLKKEKFPFSSVYFFGSRVKGTNHKDSDIDVLVELPEEYSLYDMLGVKIELEEYIGRKVDLVEYTSIKEGLKEDILSSQVPIIS